MTVRQVSPSDGCCSNRVVDLSAYYLEGKVCIKSTAIANRPRKRVHDPVHGSNWAVHSSTRLTVDSILKNFYTSGPSVVVPAREVQELVLR